MRKIAVLLSFLLTFQALSGGAVQAAYVGENYISSAGACVMDFDTGEVLYEYNGNVLRVPASMTKMMNVYCIYESLAAGEITLDTVVPISQNVYDKSRDAVYQSVLPLYYNTTYTVDEMLDVIVVYSASAAAIAMAELLGDGSEAVFVEKMNQKAAEMGLNAYYYDSCGIADNEISPISMASLARNLIRDYPDILNRSAQKAVVFHGNTYQTTNHLLDTYYYEGADGLKTGTTPAAGYCFCGTAVRNGRRMISVTMQSSSTGQRFVDTARLLDYGFSIANEKYGSIYFTDMRVFINNAEIPAFSYNGAEPHAVIVAEDLQNYGFDVRYDAETETLHIVYHPDKHFSPIPMDYYRGKNGQKAFTLAPSSNISVLVNDGAEVFELQDVYDVDGYMCISVDEFQKIYDFIWKEEENAAYITTYYKSPKAILPNGKKLTSESAYIMDFQTGDAIYEFEGEIQKPVASIAKMMSVYVMLDAVQDGEISLDTVVPISENVYNLSRMEDYKMMVPLYYDEKYTVDEMLDMIVIDSAAACVTAVAELIAGSEVEFVKRMNAKAAEIGIQSVFYNGTGVCLNPEIEKENLMSAQEVAVMTKKMIEDYPEILERTKCASVDFHGQTYYNLNKMFTDYYYEGADGFKNGMTDASGYCMCGTAVLDGKRVITVTLPSASNDARFTDTAKMFDYGFAVLGVQTVGLQEKTEMEPFFQEEDDIKINIDGNYEMSFPDQQPMIVNNRAMIPIRALMETLGKTVDWNDEDQSVTIRDETVQVNLCLENTTMVKETKNPLTDVVSREDITLEVAPIMVNDRVLLPVRAVVEAFGAAVIWEEDTQTILIIAGVC
ncbi:stalk domain-containing protein [Ructibacterium gallinarum]|uniref:Serine hydrolase n=1 Tax=Ructibacterium gallinarum TaxID=2779355 RepID=A0A9D5M4H8_9FIRM|nr:serine hydrolase [Ructibacterium gallinarum]MBE5039287.1 serine hydrolase [Ructibacterium gallinarum]